MKVKNSSHSETRRKRIETQDTSPETGMQWLKWMRSAAFEPDVVSYNAVLKLTGDAGYWQRCLQILEDMSEDGLSANIRTLNTVIDGCLQSGARDPALKLALSLHKWHLEVDEFTCSSILQAFQGKGHWQKALSLLFGMPELDLEASNFCYANAMVSCTNSGQWEHTFQLCHLMQNSKVLLDAACYSALIGACEESEKWELALRLWSEMLRAKVSPNESCFTGTLASLKAPQKWPTALELLSLMPQMKMYPTRIQWNAAMNTCASSEWQRALDLLDRMQELNIRANVDTFGIAMDAYQTGSHWESALALFQSIPSMLMDPGMRSYNNALNSLYQTDSGLELWLDALEHGVYPDLLFKGLLGLELSYH